MNIIENLKKRWQGKNYPFLIFSNGELKFSEMLEQKSIDLSKIKSGDVVALIGDFNLQSILTMLILIEKDAIILPLTIDTKAQHKYFFESALVDVVIEGNSVKYLKHKKKNKLIDELRSKQHAGLVLFSSGITGRPKAILHDLTIFMMRFETPRPALKTISFLLFDHIGGINTLFHTLFNTGTIVVPESRKVEHVLAKCIEYKIELLPTSPTFLRMMLMSGLINSIPKSLRLITYGTERMDQTTLQELCDLLPAVDFRQTYGMSELGIFRVITKARNSLFIKLADNDVETKIVENILYIRSKRRMLGYLNAKNPFDSEGWYKTNDIVESSDYFFKIIGRKSEVISVGGIKFMPTEIERVALQFKNIKFAKAVGKINPITGQHVELQVQLIPNRTIKIDELKKFLNKFIPKFMLPQRIVVKPIEFSHRFKKL